MSRVVAIVGAGIAGIYASIIMAKKGHKVFLIERAENIGGLLNSFKNGEGDTFDFGTHMIAGANNKEIDDEIVPKNWQESWNRFENEHAGSFFNGKLEENCLFVNSNHLEEPTLSQGKLDFLEAPLDSKHDSNSKEQLINRFGYTFYDQIYKPALMKFTGVSPEYLATDAYLTFGMKRLVAFSSELTQELKKVPRFDDRLAFHHFKVGSSSKPQYYPKEGGVGDWIDKLSARLDSLGVNKVTCANISSIKRDGRKVESVTINGEELEVDELVWTVPLPFLFNGAGIEYTSKKPELRKTVLLNCIFDSAPLPKSHFICNYDKDFKSFRITLYTNMQLNFNDERHRVTIEVLCDQETQVDESFKEKLIDELYRMGIMSNSAKCLSCEEKVVVNGFPVPSKSFFKNKNYQIELAKESFSNVTLLGRNTTEHWFMIDVFKDTFNKLG